jgi:DNA-binding NtrC family response regulator
MSCTLDILLADQDASARLELARALTTAGHRVTDASDGARAMVEIERQVFDVAILDVALPTIDGLVLFRRLRRVAPRTAIILTTRSGRVADAVTAMREGAFDYLAKAFDGDERIAHSIARIAERRSLQHDLESADPGAGEAMVGRSPAIVRLRDQLHTIANSDAPVLITGESGTGKELVARALHQRGRRRHGPFVALNCAGLPETLLEAELFGYERGAFTGAFKRREGRFKHANGGTLLLDEVAELPLAGQAKLLRVLQEGAVEPLGSDVSVASDVRLLSATHRNLKELIAEGRFREDLYYRLNVLSLEVPPLREREGDLMLLLGHFFRTLTQPGQPMPRLSPRAWEILSTYAFPGNVRELAHAVEHAVVLAEGQEIDVAHLPADLRGSIEHVPPSHELAPLATAVHDFERAHILHTLELTGGRRSRAAELLGISRKCLWEKLR